MSFSYGHFSSSDLTACAADMLLGSRYIEQPGTPVSVDSEQDDFIAVLSKGTPSSKLYGLYLTRSTPAAV